MKIIVQKFGGTSVATREARIAAISHIETALKNDYRVVVVVSAMGRRGDPYATDTLLGVVDEDERVAKRDLDILMSCGEAISAVVFASSLRSRGHEVTILNGHQAGIVTTHQYSDARIVDIHPARILDELERGRLVLVMGFQGATPEGDITTLGRGGSDTTACALGVALNAEMIDIFTDVEGIMTADPRIVSNATRLSQVSYAEICNLAYMGAKVIHPRAVKIAMQKNIPIRVRSTYSSDEGTLVTSAIAVMESHAVRDRYVTGVTQAPNVTQIHVMRDELPAASVFRLMADHEISVDFISVSEHETKYTVQDKDAHRAHQLLLQEGAHPNVTPDCAKVSVVGAGIAGTPGIMATIVGALSSENIRILQTADSHTTIWCLVRRDQMESAVRCLHHAFHLGMENE